MRRAAKPRELQALASKIHEQIKESFPLRLVFNAKKLFESDFSYSLAPSKYTTVDMIKKAIMLLEVWHINYFIGWLFSSRVV